MKALCIDMEYYLYPDGIKDFNQFLNFLNDNYGRFIPMTRLAEEGSVPPFFKREDTKTALMNVSQISEVTEADVEILSENDYKLSLENAVDEICRHCSNFEGNKESCEMGDIEDSLCLNGKCEFFEIE